MSKQAKISLTADIVGFKKKIEELKTSLTSISKLTVSPKVAANIKTQAISGLEKQATELNKKLSSAETHLNNLMKNPKPNLSGLAQMSTKIGEMKKHLESIKKLKDEIGKGKLDVDVPDAPAKSDSIMSKVLKGGGRIAAGVAGGLGILSSASRAMDIAHERQSVAALTGGNEVFERGNRIAGKDLGYSGQERRQSAMETAGAIGRDISSAELSRLIDLQEIAQRGWGTDKGTTSEFMGAARKTGANDQGKLLASSMGAAVAAKLEGSQIGQYLQSMTGFMSEMSQGVEISHDSLNGFAASLSAMPFFKNDPGRSFNTARNLNTAFSGGDRFQQAQAARSMLMSVPGASPEALEMRRGMGLFGNLGEGTDEATLQKQGYSKGFSKTMNLKPEDIIKNTFRDVMSSTEGMSRESQLYEFGQRTNTKGAEAYRLFEGAKSGKFEKGDIEKFKDAQLDPMERLNKTFSGNNEKMITLQSTISNLKDVLADNIGPPLATIAHGFEALFGKAEKPGEGVDTTKQFGDVATAGVGAAALAPLIGMGPGAAVAGAGYLGAKMPDMMDFADSHQPSMLKRFNSWAGEKMGMYSPSAPSTPSSMPTPATMGAPGAPSLDVSGLTEALNKNTDATLKSIPGNSSGGMPSYYSGSKERGK